MKPLPPEIITIIKRQKANELIRQQQQGLGKPLVSFKIDDHQFVTAANTIYHSQRWKTFPDFLSDYLKTTLGTEWGSSEIKKPLSERHIILKWYDEFCRLQTIHNVSGDIKSMPMTGVVYCYLGLAYSLFLIKHNVELQERLLKRLRNPTQFQGAYYELIIANALIRAGFELVLEDETNGNAKHCEFSAVSKKKNKKYWIEAKMRGVAGVLGKTAEDGVPTHKEATSQLIKHINAAFKKPAPDERLIFIDLNTDPHFDKTSNPIWVEKAAKLLREYEKKLPEEQSAYILITNMPFHRNLQSEHSGQAIMAHGLGNDFWLTGAHRLSDMYRRKQKHIDIHDIIESLRQYPKLPPTFDGSLPSETFGKKTERIIIGETYFFEDIGETGTIGTVTTASISEQEKKMYIGISVEGGNSQILVQPISDETLVDYKAHPDAFFGTILPASKKTETPYELFEFFLESYLKTPKEKLLEFMNGSPDMETLRKMSQENLAFEYCERLVSWTVNRQNK